jgi:hypothetical protein
LTFFTNHGIFYQCRDSVPRPDNVPCFSKVNEQAMPASRRARKKRSRTRKAKCREPYPFILQIEEPLTDAIHYTEALRLMGHGIIAQDDNGGDAIIALAWQTAQRLEKVKKIWNKMLDERRRATDSQAS